MKQKIALGILLLLLQGCGLLKPKKTAAPNRPLHLNSSNLPSHSHEIPAATPIRPKSPNAAAIDLPGLVIETARSFEGVPYRYGGTTDRGMDCSGLLFTSFQTHNIPFPRSSYLMADTGQKIDLNEVIAGDLLFFRTTRRGGRINHVGLVVDASDAEIQFIHASTSRGVIISSLTEAYWRQAFVKAVRVF